MKRCKGCGLDKPLDEYFRNSARPGGYGVRCNPCLRQRQEEFNGPVQTPRSCVTCGKPIPYPLPRGNGEYRTACSRPCLLRSVGLPETWVFGISPERIEIP